MTAAPLAGDARRGPQRRWLIAVAGVALALPAALVMPIGRPGAGCASAASTHRVAIVVEHGNGAVLTACVGFDSDSISGIDALATSGIEYRAEGFGSNGQAICQVDAEPQQYSSCFDHGMFWALAVSRQGGQWTLSSRGASSTSLRDGDAEGFRYVSQAAPAVPDRSAAGACAALPPPTARPPSPPPSSAASAPTPPVAPSARRPAPSSSETPAADRGTAPVAGSLGPSPMATTDPPVSSPSAGSGPGGAAVAPTPPSIPGRVISGHARDVAAAPTASAATWVLALAAMLLLAVLPLRQLRGGRRR